jgi:hypothetical protein
MVKSKSFALVLIKNEKLGNVDCFPLIFLFIFFLLKICSFCSVQYLLCFLSAPKQMLYHLRHSTNPLLYRLFLR